MKNMQIVLSTRNPSKAEQIKAIFADSKISVATLDEAGIAGKAVEDGATLEENALKKALFVHQQDPSVWTIADDTGIFIDALDGKPGVHTADWSGGNKTTEKMTDWILKQLKGLQNRSATFKTVVAIVSPEGKQYFFTGEVRGKILVSPRPATQPKMPYAPIFVPEEIDKVLGEMTSEERKQFSHRGRAFRQAREFLETVL